MSAPAPWLDDGRRARAAILISGRGSNMDALADACAASDFPAEIVLVLSNRPKAAGLDLAARRGLAIRTIDHKAFPDRPAFETAMRAALEDCGADLVLSAGFLRVLTADFTRHWEGRMLNIHPSLLPSFRGLKVHKQALDAGVKISGCTVHFVTPDLDAGPILGQAAVPVLPEDTPDSLAARILTQEHSLYPDCLRLLAGGQAWLEAGKVRFADPAKAADMARLSA